MVAMVNIIPTVAYLLLLLISNVTVTHARYIPRARNLQDEDQRVESRVLWDELSSQSGRSLLRRSHPPPPQLGSLLLTPYFHNAAAHGNGVVRDAENRHLLNPGADGRGRANSHLPPERPKAAPGEAVRSQSVPPSQQLGSNPSGEPYSPQQELGQKAHSVEVHSQKAPSQKAPSRQGTIHREPSPQGLSLQPGSPRGGREAGSNARSASASPATGQAGTGPSPPEVHNNQHVEEQRRGRTSTREPSGSNRAGSRPSLHSPERSAIATFWKALDHILRNPVTNLIALFTNSGFLTGYSNFSNLCYGILGPIIGAAQTLATAAEKEQVIRDSLRLQGIDPGEPGTYTAEVIHKLAVALCDAKVVVAVRKWAEAGMGAANATSGAAKTAGATIGHSVNTAAAAVGHAANTAGNAVQNAAKAVGNVAWKAANTAARSAATIAAPYTGNSRNATRHHVRRSIELDDYLYNTLSARDLGDLESDFDNVESDLNGFSNDLDDHEDNPNDFEDVLNDFEDDLDFYWWLHEMGMARTGDVEQTEKGYVGLRRDMTYDMI